MKKSSVFLLFCLTGTLLLSLSSCAKREDILIMDFEGDNYGDWTVTGEAFGKGPTRGRLESQSETKGIKGSGLANSFLGGDKSTGALLSPEFRIERRFIHALVGGGDFREKTCINLVVDGRTVRTATGHRLEFLEWSSWDVSELSGQTVRIQIVDAHAGGWGHVSVDHIVQSDRTFLLPDLKREITLARPYLHLPVKRAERMRRLSLTSVGDKIHDFDIELAESEPDFWAFIDVAELMGKSVVLQVNQPYESDPKVLDLITQDDRIRDLEGIYREKYRPQFHFTSRRGWNNDPNGLVYHDGRYHLFYQHNPYGWSWGNMHWGHAVSTDLVHWRERGEAIRPDKRGTIFSGSAVVDEGNTGGFQKGEAKSIVCFYTSAGGQVDPKVPFTQSLAFSTDNGKTFTKFGGNPVVNHIADSNRDPKVLWHEPTKTWIMALYLTKNDYTLLSSPDLKTWTRLPDFQIPGASECPDLFELPVDGNPQKTKWVFWAANGSYRIGTFDGKAFTAESGVLKAYAGGTAYAAQTYSDIPKSDGRRIQIPWLQCAMTGMPFNQQMGFPVELTLRTTKDGIRLHSTPVAEINGIHGREWFWKSQKIDPGRNLLDGIEGDTFDILAEIAIGKAGEIGIAVRGIPVVYDAGARLLSCGKHSAPLEPEQGRIRLRILVDRASIEIFGNDGRVYMPIGILLPEKERPLELFVRNGSALVEKLIIREVKSIWEAPGFALGDKLR